MPTSQILTEDDHEAGEGLVKDEEHKESPTTGNEAQVDRDKRHVLLRWFPIHVNSYVAVLSMCLFFEMTLSTYTVGVMRTLERRFSLSSRESGLIFAMNDIAHIFICTFVGYFGDKYHKPRILSVSVIFVVLSALLMASPALLPNPGAHSHPSMEQGYNASYGPSRNGSMGLCDSDRVMETCESNDLGGELSTTKTAFVIFVVAMLCNGIGGSSFVSIGISFIDENAPPSKTSFYIGVVTAMYAIGPIMGFLTAAITLRIPENLDLGSSLSASDPSFIGAWWVGFLIMGIGSLISSIPLWFFPKVLPTHRSLVNKDAAMKQPGDAENGEMQTSIMNQVKAFPKSLLRLIKNKPYLILLAFSTLLCYLILGVFAGLSRYLEIHFRLPAFTANIVTAVDSALAGALGGLAGGIYMSRKKLTPHASSKVLVASWTATVIGLFILLFMACPQPPLAAERTGDGLVVTNPCTEDCGCSTQSRNAFRPICGSDGLTYFSACHAGCTETYENSTYGSCQCMASEHVTTTHEGRSSDPGNASSLTGISGMCSQFCPALIPFAVVMFVMCMLGSVCRVPLTTVQLRIVDEKDRSFALGFNSFVYNLLGFIPAPLLYGYLLDSSCILWQDTCDGSGSCLVYDTSSVRRLTYGVTLGFQIIALLATIALVFFVRRMNFPSEKVEGEVDESHIEMKQIEDGFTEIEVGKI